MDTPAAAPSYRWLILLVLTSLLLNITAWLSIGLLPDEAYYWVWSQRLQAGYFDHPSLVAWLIRPFTELLGSHTWAIRLPGVFTWLLSAWLAYDLGVRLYARRSAGMIAVFIWASLPIIQLGFHIITPDTPMLLFGWLSYYFACRAVMEDAPGLWILTGLSIGLSVAGKYPGGLIAIGLFFALPLAKEGRRYLLTPWPWLATVTALLAFSPVLWWNWKHDWISFAFQLGHGVETNIRSWQNSLEMLMIFIGGQLGVVMPWTLLAMLYAGLYGARRLLREHTLHYPILLLGFLLPLLIFGLAALTAKSQPNWPVSAYIPGTLLLAGVADRWLYPIGTNGQRRTIKYLLISAFLFSMLLVNLLRFPQWLGYIGVELPPQRTQLSQTYGWDEVKKVLLPLLRREDAENSYGNQCIVIGDKLQTASMLGYLLQNADRVTTASDTRSNQFRLWQQEKPVQAEAYCLFFEQFERRSDIPQKRTLAGQGSWKLAQTLKVTTPDLVTRWSAFYTRER